MAYTMRPPKQISYDETMVDSSDYLQDIKKEPLDIPYEEATSFGVKNEHLEYQNEVDFNLNDTRTHFIVPFWVY